MANTQKAVKNKIKLDKSDKIIRGFSYVFISIFALACLLPFLLIIATSFSTEGLIRKTGFTIIPKGFTTYAYNLIFENPMNMLGSYAVTVSMAVVGTGVGLFVIAMTGYALQRKDFPFRNAISFYIYFTSLFSAGLAPFYLIMTKFYHLKDSYLAVFLPLLMTPWLIILMKNFIKSIPHEITESGKIDGAGDMKIFTALILPMVKPALATIGLFLALGYWNEWYYSSLFLSAQVDYKPLQYNLYEVVNKIQALKNSVAGSYVSFDNLPQETLKMATAIVATGPIILLYPFVQKYFIGGITVGAVKG
ncbi:carbohydrate ABC transporter permease [Anaerosporobacter faecicola]|uniref:carbohydrate ABC transporter permease n=1 Tax=Anaerosporobacter faecicola TaxID=2718714 RepID=UPI00143A34A6|nr:carbohydrate ABC transporter permease [Anaerosporobacter faecicola]